MAKEIPTNEETLKDTTQTESIITNVDWNEYPPVITTKHPTQRPDIEWNPDPKWPTRWPITNNPKPRNPYGWPTDGLEERDPLLPPATLKEMLTALNDGADPCRVHFTLDGDKCLAETPLMRWMRESKEKDGSDREEIALLAVQDYSYLNPQIRIAQQQMLIKWLAADPKNMEAYQTALAYHEADNNSRGNDLPTHLYEQQNKTPEQTPENTNPEQQNGKNDAQATQTRIDDVVEGLGTLRNFKHAQTETLEHDLLNFGGKTKTTEI